MRKVCLIGCVVLALTMCSWAQSKVDIYGGYSFFRADMNESLTGITPQNTHGWDASVTGNINRYFGLTGDISGQYKTESALVAGVGSGEVKVREHNFLFGPTITARNKSRVTPFVHALFGVSHLTGEGSASLVGSGTTTASDSNNAFAMAIGGGLDVKLARVVSLRIGQIDWLRTHHFDEAQNNVRFSAGLVLNLGGK